jgi:hypothetical protein
MATMTVAAVQAAYVLMDRKATLAKVEELVADPAVQAADLVVFPEAFVPGTPIWIDGPPIWDGDEQWFAMLADQAVVVPSEATDRLVRRLGLPAPIWSSASTNANRRGARFTTRCCTSRPMAGSSASTAS